MFIAGKFSPFPLTWPTEGRLPAGPLPSSLETRGNQPTPSRPKVPAVISAQLGKCVITRWNSKCGICEIIYLVSHQGEPNIESARLRLETEVARGRRLGSWHCFCQQVYKELNMGHGSNQEMPKQPPNGAWPGARDSARRERRGCHAKQANWQTANQAATCKVDNKNKLLPLEVATAAPSGRPWKACTGVMGYRERGEKHCNDISWPWPRRGGRRRSCRRAAPS